MSADARTAVVDENSAITLIHVGRLPLLAAIPGFDFTLPVDVREEITGSGQRRVLIERNFEHPFFRVLLRAAPRFYDGQNDFLVHPRL